MHHGGPAQGARMASLHQTIASLRTAPLGSTLAVQISLEDGTRVRGDRPTRSLSAPTNGAPNEDMCEQASVSDSGREVLVIKPLPNPTPGMGPAVSPQALQTLGSLPLNVLGLEAYVVQEVGERDVPDRLPVDVSAHPSARTVVAREMLARLQEDVQGYAARENGALLPRVRHLTKADFDGLLQRAAAAGSDEAVGPLVSAFVAPALALLAELEGRLHALDSEDRHVAEQAFEASLMHANASGGALDATALLYWMRRYAGQRPTLDAVFLMQCLMSSRGGEDVRGANPFATQVDGALNLLALGLLHVNRVAQANRAVSAARELASALRTMGPSAGSDLGGRRAQQAADALADVLTSGRYYGTWTSEGLSVDPRFLVFEAVFDLTLRRRQVEMVTWFVRSLEQGVSRVQQMIMGAGKVQSTTFVHLFFLMSRCLNGLCKRA
jgi:hypothetical protein